MEIKGLWCKSINPLTKKSTATTNKRHDLMVHIFIKINATWIIHLLSFVARYFGVFRERSDLRTKRSTGQFMPDNQILWVSIIRKNRLSTLALDFFRNCTA